MSSKTNKYPGLGIKLLLGCCLLSTSVKAQLKPAKKSITKREAIAIAEDFICRNGYTQAPADTSAQPLSYELFDALYPVDTLLKLRHNRLQPRASYTSRTGDLWHIGFLFQDLPGDGLNVSNSPVIPAGRAVIVDAAGQVRLQHKSPAFSKFRKL